MYGQARNTFRSGFGKLPVPISVPSTVKKSDHPIMSVTEQSPSAGAAAHHVLIFTKYPTPGYAKTRLIPAVGAERAADISRQLTERTVSVVRSLLLSSSLASSLVSRIHYASSSDDVKDENCMREWLGEPDAAFSHREFLLPQNKGGLGDRLDAAFAVSFRDNACKVVVVGADIPEIGTEVLENAFTKLDHVDVVIGPAQDGGYYLLGMKQLYSRLFRSVPWSTERVFDVTMRIAKEEGLSVAKLPTMRDVDVPDDLPYFDSLFAASET